MSEKSNSPDILTYRVRLTGTLPEPSTHDAAGFSRRSVFSEGEGKSARVIWVHRRKFWGSGWGGWTGSGGVDLSGFRGVGPGARVVSWGGGMSGFGRVTGCFGTRPVRVFGAGHEGGLVIVMGNRGGTEGRGERGGVRGGAFGRRGWLGVGRGGGLGGGLARCIRGLELGSV